MQYHWPIEAVCEPGTVSPGSLKWLNMWTLYHRLQFLLKYQGKSLKSLLQHLGSPFFSNWHYLKHNNICIPGQVLKTKKIYTFVEEGGYRYCTHVGRLPSKGLFVLYPILFYKEQNCHSEPDIKS